MPTPAGPRAEPEPDPAREWHRLVREAAGLFHRGEIAAATDAALLASNAALESPESGRADRLAAAALVVIGVPDASSSAGVELMCRRAIHTGSTPDRSTLAQLHAQLAIALHLRGRLSESAAEVELAEQFASGGSPVARGAATLARQWSIAGLGRPAELLELGGRLLDAAARAVDPFATQAELWARVWRIDGLLRLSQSADAQDELASLDVLATVSGDCLTRWNAAVARAGISHCVGRFDDAVEAAAKARSLLPPSQRSMSEPVFVAQVMLVAIDRATAPAQLETARATAIGAPLVAVAMTGRFDLELGDRPSAQVAYESVRARLADVGPDRRGLPTMTAAVELAVAFGDAATASDLYERLLPYEGLMIASTLGAVGPVDHFLALVERSDGRTDDAVRHARMAVDLAARGGYGPWLARARLGLAESLIADSARARAEALALAELAAAGAERLGMRGVRRAAAHLAADLSGRSMLTPRELEIAQLVAGGAANREIAAQLVVSERTVETHVHNILTKLDLRSRTQLASWVAGSPQDA